MGTGVNEPKIYKTNAYKDTTVYEKSKSIYNGDSIYNGGNGGGGGGGLPSGYTSVLAIYLQNLNYNKDNNYFLADIDFNSSDITEICFITPQTRILQGGNPVSIFRLGQGPWGNTQQLMLYTYSSWENYTIYNPNSTYSNNNPITPINSEIIARIEKNTLTYNNNLFSINYSPNVNIGNKFFPCGQSTGGLALSMEFATKILIVQDENNIDKLHLIPCKKDDTSELGFYDVVSGNFYTKNYFKEYV